MKFKYALVITPFLPTNLNLNTCFLSFIFVLNFIIIKLSIQLNIFVIYMPLISKNILFLEYANYLDTNIF